MTTPSEEARAALDAAVEEALDSYATDMVLIWSRESDEAKTERDAMERELLKVKQELRVLLAKPKAHDRVCAECERKKELWKREPLVQLVLEKYNALTACALNGQTSCENEDAALFEALRQLQDWSPT